MLTYLDQTNTLANVGNLLQTLITVHGYEIFNTPVFNGDPHPGNILTLSTCFLDTKSENESPEEYNIFSTGKSYLDPPKSKYANMSAR